MGGAVGLGMREREHATHLLEREVVVQDIRLCAFRARAVDRIRVLAHVELYDAAVDIKTNDRACGEGAARFGASGPARVGW